MPLAALRRSADPHRVAALWRDAQGSPQTGAPCPTCARPMSLVALADTPLWLDVCRPCQHVWFDGGEVERLSAIAPPPAAPREPELPMEARALLARLHATRAREQTERLVDAAASTPGAVQTAAAWFGLPGELDEQVFAAHPTVTWGVSILIALLAVAAFADPDAIASWGLVPATPLRHGGLTFLTSVALHAGVIHLLGNLYFLLVFGDNVEDALGQARWLALFVVAGLAGGLAHVALDPRSDVPVVGASGAISGLLAFYAVAFPRARLGWYIRYRLRGVWLRTRAWVMFLVWVVLQLLGAWAQVRGCSNVSAVAHLGGAAVGGLAAIWWRSRVTPGSAAA
ncbi:MAG: hypothetical protein AMXMBFR64_11140 [Myxococcales bacterium]